MINLLKQMYKLGLTTPEKVIEDIIVSAKQTQEMNIWIVPPKMEFIKTYLNQLKSIDLSAPLWGIPFAIKDNIDLEGVPTTAACPGYAYDPTESAEVVKRLVAAGAIPVGKTNLDQFATGLVGTRSPYGETYNALKKELISGGSSAGSAVAVAMKQAVFSLGTDTAGSGRVPAALNNIIGYKSSLGAWPTKGVVPACASLDCVTVFADSLEDAYLVDNVARGVCTDDCWSRDIPQPHSARPKRICLPNEKPYFYGEFKEEYEEAWDRAVEKVKTLGIPIEYIDYTLFSDAANILYGGPMVAERWADLKGFVTEHEEAVFPVTYKVLLSATKPEFDAAAVFKAMHKLQRYKLETSKVIKDAVLIMPTCGGTYTRAQVRENPIETNNDMGRYTNHCNLLDLCAVAVPSGFANQDVPFGITMFALSDSESLIKGLAESYLTCDRIEVAVCGLHMRGFPLEQQMREYGAYFDREEKTAPKYKMIKLINTTPPKPGLIKVDKGGEIDIEIWKMPLEKFGMFTAAIPSPLGIGKIELRDGKEVPGFICEGFAEIGSQDITDSGGWRNSLINSL